MLFEFSKIGSRSCIGNAMAVLMAFNRIVRMLFFECLGEKGFLTVIKMGFELLESLACFGKFRRLFINVAVEFRDGSSNDF